MKARTIARAASLAAAALALVGASATASYAASPSPSPSSPAAGKTITVPANNITFAIAASDGRKNDGRTSFAWLAQPGQVIDDHVIVYNLGRVKARFFVYTIDAVTSQDGAFALSQLTDPQSGFGTWASVKPQLVTLAGGQSAVVPVTIRVPENATPGDTAGGVVVSSIPDRPDITTVEQQVAVATRIGIKSVVRVAGDLRASLAVQGLTTTFEPSLTEPGFGRLTATWTVVNDGNVRVEADRSVTVDGLVGGRLVDDTRPVLNSILPGTSITESVTYDHVLAGIKLTTEVTAHPVLLDGDAPVAPDATAQDVQWAISWVLLLILLAIGLLTWALVRRLRRRGDGWSSGGRHGAGTATTSDPTENLATPVETGAKA